MTIECVTLGNFIASAFFIVFVPRVAHRKGKHTIKAASLADFSSSSLRRI